jgi:protoporphyrinogen oxidase
MYTILGAGIAGLSMADHLDKKKLAYILYEAKSHGGGHIHSREVDGFVWDEGPHFTFTKSEYVRQYFAENCNNEFLEYPIKPTNIYKGTFIPHPAQSNMYAIPEPLRTQCITDVLQIRKELSDNFLPANYQEWIDYAFGETFANTFPKPYTIKYWTTDPKNLATDWIGKRVYFPETNDMVNSAQGPLEKLTYYINKVRYPLSGGFYTYIKSVEARLKVNYNKAVSSISFDKKLITFNDGEVVPYDKLINTLPLPWLILNSDAPESIKNQAQILKCSQLLIVNVIADHVCKIDNQLLFVYDEQYYSTRINFTELLSPNNGITGQTGIQVEVYFSDYHERKETIEAITSKVLSELVEMGLIGTREDILSYHTQFIDWANVIFDNNRRDAQDQIYQYLETKGMHREEDDLEPMTEWETKEPKKLGQIALAGRFGQWKYFWTDDCVLRSKYISENM